MDVYITHTTLGIIGSCVGVGLLLAPTPTFIRMLKAKSAIEENSPIPYLVALMSSLVWLLYGLPSIHPYSKTLLYLNGAGISIQTIFLTISTILVTSNKHRALVMAVYGIEVVVVSAIAFLTITFIQSIATRTQIVGNICCLVSITTYGYTIFAFVKEVRKTRRVDKLSTCLILVTLGNAIIWTTYGFFPFDPYMVISNGVSTLMGVLQVVAYVSYKKNSSAIVDT